ncbi:GNAT family N-acetyltransferase [Viridibacillus sp. FSL R5-0477]|uniref:GNAT family acetyltransferase n=1 Tax=Viridibacillus arenosi FSL R5-213 TaxID=1227360 RepID=W4F1X6_9BACL|nr:MULTISPECIES: GNAT family N-acetyltransferase [Viridibacillus]ETT86863.1 GNAT family acetyltransferase [Viridibacillus arenosi FSL R5-213]OMC83288.1 GNAT family N-acetyltransferase [Viridibacillus sp. FSL H8-0123]OMC88198.1 GNAT family N-acetyltransferase [Viridibacillus arenosi]
MKNVMINGKNYKLISRYQDDNELRNSFNLLTKQTYNFDFEKWYKSGYWKENCILYSLLDNDKMVSHITVSVIDFIVLGEKKRFVQLGTVMTDEQYRNQGLSRVLMDTVIEEWENKCDMFYLFANDSVLDFYPKFGFISVDEYQASKQISIIESPYSVRKMDIDNVIDLNLLYETAKNAAAQFALSMVDNAGLVMFYCNYFELFSFKYNLFYIQDLNAIAVADYEEDTLILYDILATKKIEIENVLNALATEQTKRAILNFMPINSENYEVSLYKEEDSTLMVMGDKEKLFKNNKLMFPMLSHT